MIRPRALAAIFIACACTPALAMYLIFPQSEGNLAVPEAPQADAQVGRAAALLALDADCLLEEPDRLPACAADCETETESAEDPITLAKKGLRAKADAALDGVLFLNEVLDDMLEFAYLPLGAHPDMAYEDSDAIAYKLQGTPEGTDAWVLAGMQPYHENGKTYRYLQLAVEVDHGETEYMLGAVRSNPHVDLSISYDETKPGTATRFSVVLTRDVDLTASRTAGIDARDGRFATGSMYWVDLLKNPYGPTSATIGMIDGRRVQARTFQGTSPLAGDIELDTERLAALLEQLHTHLSTISGE